MPLNTSILKNKTLVSRCKDLTVPVQIPPPHPGKGKILQPRARTTDKDLSGSARRGQVTGCVQKADRKGKNFFKLLELQKVAPDTKSCSKVAEHNRDRPQIPANSNHFPFPDF